jgi:glyoxylase-like metal-dependent hydrolase (beta-lactamase superfamily II)
MKITQHGAYLTQITRMTTMNCFLVREEDGLTLVDTGMSGSANAILKAAQGLGAPIRRIALTHAHIDHVGSLDALHRALPDAKVLASARSARFMRGDLSLDPGEQHSKLRGGFPKCQTQPHRLLNPGERVGSLEVIASPGHSPDHIAFFDHRDRTLLAGDAYSTKGGIAVAGVIRWLFPLPALATWSKVEGVRSAEALLALNPSRLAVGHGQTLENPTEAMQTAIAEAKRRLGKA